MIFSLYGYYCTLKYIIILMIQGRIYISNKERYKLSKISVHNVRIFYIKTTLSTIISDICVYTWICARKRNLYISSRSWVGCGPWSQIGAERYTRFSSMQYCKSIRKLLLCLHNGFFNFLFFLTAMSGFNAGICLA
jgi:hypothetical protein